MAVRPFLQRLVAVLPAALLGCSGRGTVIESRREPPPAKVVPDSGHLVASPAIVPRPGFDAGVDATDLDAAVEDELTPRSGSRIAVKGYVAGDQILTMTSSEDRRLGACTVQPGADGKARCLPATGDVVFRDAACTVPLLRGSGSSDCSGQPPSYTAYAAASACPSSKVNVLRVGAPVYDLTSKTTYELDPDTGHCREGAVGGLEPFYSTTPSPAADWVAFERKVVAVGHGLGVEMWRGQDGSRIPGSFVLLPSDVACQPRGPQGAVSSTQPNHCIPANRAQEARNSYYLDSACIDFVTVGAHSCDPPTISERPAEQVACSPERYFELGKEVAPGSLFWRLPGELMGQTPDQAPCQAASPYFLANSSYYVIGTEIDVGRYPLLELEPRGSGRIRPYYWAASGRKLLPSPVPGSSLDAQRGTTCQPTIFADGKLRCVDAVATLDHLFFADPACTVDVYRVETLPLPSDCTEPSAMAEWVAEMGNGPVCSAFPFALGAIRPIAGEHHGALYVHDQTNSAAKCIPFDPSMYPPEASAQMYDLGDPVDPSTTFPEVIETDL